MPSSNVGFTVSSISTVFSTPLTLAFPPAKVGVPVCVCPLGPSDSASVDDGVTGTTTGVYLAFALVPFVSTRTTVTVVALPVKAFSGTKVTVPSFATMYFPSPGTTFSVLPSSNVAGTLSSIGTVSSFPLIVTVPLLNSGLPVCVAPWISSVIVSIPVGVAGFTSGV